MAVVLKLTPPGVSRAPLRTTVAVNVATFSFTEKMAFVKPTLDSSSSTVNVAVLAVKFVLIFAPPVALLNFTAKLWFPFPIKSSMTPT